MRRHLSCPAPEPRGRGAWPDTGQGNPASCTIDCVASSPPPFSTSMALTWVVRRCGWPTGSPPGGALGCWRCSSRLGCARPGRLSELSAHCGR